MRVTALEPQEHRPDRWSLFLDGAFAFGLDGALVVAEGIAVGLELGPAAVERLRLASAEQDLYSAALRFLEPRPRSRAEVRRRLTRPHPRRTPPEPAAVERVLERLAAAGVLDDRDFADFWIDNRDRFSPRGARALGMELRQRGVDRATAETLTAPERDAGRALAAGRQRLRSLAGLDYQTFRTRLGPFLLRRGFDYTTARETVRQLWAETHDDAPPTDDDDAPSDAQSLP
ncbi:MAG TPA: regulatory protein RecX [Ktedonobacterales bacterium]|jgi:regulatory protein